MLTCSIPSCPCSQPLFLNNVTLLAAAWFPSSERDIAVAASLLCVAIGSMVISVYAPYAVKGPGQLDLLFGWQVPAWCAVLVAGVLITKDQPPEPPSISAALLRASRRTQRGGGEVVAAGAEGQLAPVSSLTQALRLCGHANFMVLNFSSALLTGLVMMMATIVGQMLQPCGHAPGVAGSSLAALSAASGVSVGLYLWLLARNEKQQEAAVEAGTSEAGAHKSYVAHQVGWSSLCAGGIALALGASPLGTSPGDTAAVVAAWGLLGLLSGTLLNGALTMEHAVRILSPSSDFQLAYNSPPCAGRDDVPDAAQRVRLPARHHRQRGVLPPGARGHLPAAAAGRPGLQVRHRLRRFLRPLRRHRPAARLRPEA